MAILWQFVLRLAFGLAVSMAVTSPALVTAGFYRVHLYVLLGLSVVAAAVAATVDGYPLWLPIGLAVLSYMGSVMWLYERTGVGRLVLVVIAAGALAGAWLPVAGISASGPWATILWWLDAPSSGLLLGSTLAAMLLGHWYLNTPTMKLGPLRRLILLMSGSLGWRTAVCGVALGLAWSGGNLPPGDTAGWFLLLRWLAGIVGVAVVALMAWLTLAIPNTQSATGILYVAVIVVFLGELTSQLLSVGSAYPL